MQLEQKVKDISCDIVYENQSQPQKHLITTSGMRARYILASA